MKGKKHGPEQIIKKLREAETMIAAGKTIGQVVQALEISEQTLQGSGRGDGHVADLCDGDREAGASGRDRAR
jgi:hypothetical protein